MFKRILGVGAVMLAVAAGGVGQARAEAKQDFTLVNKTGYDIEKVYVSPTKSDDWEEDVLGQSVLQNGQKVHITFNRSNKSCNWDLMVVYSDDNSKVSWSGFDLCSISTIKIFYNRKSDTTSAETE